MTASRKVNGFGHHTNSAMLPKISVQACRTSNAPTKSDLPRRRWTCSGVSSSEDLSAMAQQPSGMVVGRLAVAHCHFTVHQNVLIALGTLDAPPLAAGQIVHDLVRQHAQAVEIVN